MQCTETTWEPNNNKGHFRVKNSSSKWFECHSTSSDWWVKSPSEKLDFVDWDDDNIPNLIWGVCSSHHQPAIQHPVIPSCWTSHAPRATAPFRCQFRIRAGQDAGATAPFRAWNVECGSGLAIFEALAKWWYNDYLVGGLKPSEKYELVNWDEYSKYMGK